MAIEVVPRSYWTSASRGGSAISSAGVDGVAMHWPASAGSFGVESKSKVASRLRGWRNFHVNGRGWSDIGYNLGVDMAGRGWDLRGLWRVGAHAASASNPRANHHYIGILFIMGVNDTPTAAMINAFQYLRTQVVFGAHGSDANELLGHREVPGAQTACPGNKVISLKGTLDNPYREKDEDMPLNDADKKWIRNTITEVLAGGNNDGGRLNNTRVKYTDYNIAAHVRGIQRKLNVLTDGVEKLMERQSPAMRLDVHRADVDLVALEEDTDDENQ